MDEKSSQEITAEILIELLRQRPPGYQPQKGLDRKLALEIAGTAGEMFKAICKAVNYTMSPRFALNMEDEEEKA